MTDKEMKKLAKLTAEMIIEHFEVKQEEWNDQFKNSLDSLKDQGLEDVEISFISENEAARLEIDDLEQQLEKAIEDEDYTKAGELNTIIVRLKSKLK